MIAYDKTLLDNILLIDEANSLKKSGFINLNQYKTITDELPILKSQKNILIRFGFFLLGCFLYSSICGAISLFSIGSNNLNYEILVLVYSLIGFAGTEFLVRDKQYGFGLDDAFLIGAQILLFVSVSIFTNGNYLLISVTIAITATICYLRYLHLLTALFACLGITATVAYLMFEFGTIGKSILPFVMMAFSAMLYFLSKKAITNLKLPYYSKGIQLVNGFSLILFYLSGNYYVVRQLSSLLLNNSIPAEKEISLAFIFYAFTLIVPVIYIVYSLLKKDKIILWIGFLAFGFSIFTIRYYHHILPTEISLTFGGLILFAVTYFSIKKIKTNESGITFLPDRFTNSNSLLNVKAIIAVSQFGLKPEVKPEDSPMTFGGGGFSGGGSDGTF